MEKRLYAEKFIEEWLCKHSLPEKVRNDFAVLGFMSAYTGLLNNGDDVQKEIITLREMKSEKYFGFTIQRNIDKKDDITVQALSVYIDQLRKQKRKSFYRNAMEEMENGKFTDDGTNKSPRASISSIVTSIQLGVDIYQKSYTKTLNVNHDSSKYISTTTDNINEGEVRSMNELEKTQEEVIVVNESASDKSIVTSEVSNELITMSTGIEHEEASSNSTSDKQFVTSEGVKINPSEFFGQPFESTDDYEFHEYADMLPLMAHDELALLTEGIRNNGQYEPILLYNNKIVDGRNRYKACKVANLPITAANWVGSEEQLILYIHEKNINRRDLTSSQRAMSSYKLLKEHKKLAKLRQGERNDLKSQIEIMVDNAYPETTPGRKKKKDKHRATDDVAKLLKTNRTYVNCAEHIFENAKDLMDVVLKKELTITKAYELAKSLEHEKDRDKALEMYRNKEGTIDSIVKKIKAERNGTLQSSDENAAIIITIRHDVPFDDDDIKYLEERYKVKVKIQKRRTPKE